MKESVLFLGWLKNNNVMIGIYIGAHLLGLDWLCMFSFDIMQFAMFRLQILDRGLFHEHGQIIVFEINVLGIILSLRYTIPDYEGIENMPEGNFENDGNNSSSDNDNLDI